jgi:hypothetical protein
MLDTGVRRKSSVERDASEKKVTSARIGKRN